MRIVISGRNVYQEQSTMQRISDQMTVYQLKSQLLLKMGFAQTIEGREKNERNHKRHGNSRGLQDLFDV